MEETPTPSPGVRPMGGRTPLPRADSESPVISMKRMMAQLVSELEAMRQQQEVLVNQIGEQRKEDEAFRDWILGRFTTMEHAVQEATAAASAAAAAAVRSQHQAISAANPSLPQTGSFEFARQHRVSKASSASGSGHGHAPPHLPPTDPTPHSPSPPHHLSAHPLSALAATTSPGPPGALPFGSVTALGPASRLGPSPGTEGPGSSPAPTQIDTAANADKSGSARRRASRRPVLLSDSDDPPLSPSGSDEAGRSGQGAAGREGSGGGMRSGRSGSIASRLRNMRRGSASPTKRSQLGQGQASSPFATITTQAPLAAAAAEDFPGAGSSGTAARGRRGGAGSSGSGRGASRLSTAQGQDPSVGPGVGVVGAMGEHGNGAGEGDGGRISEVEEERSRHGSGRGPMGRRRGSMAPPRPQGALSLQGELPSFSIPHSTPSGEIPAAVAELAARHTSRHSHSHGSSHHSRDQPAPPASPHQHPPAPPASPYRPLPAPGPGPGPTPATLSLSDVPSPPLSPKLYRSTTSRHNAPTASELFHFHSHGHSSSQPQIPADLSTSGGEGPAPTPYAAPGTHPMSSYGGSDLSWGVGQPHTAHVHHYRGHHHGQHAHPFFQHTHHTHTHNHAFNVVPGQSQSGNADVMGASAYGGGGHRRTRSLASSSMPLPAGYRRTGGHYRNRSSTDGEAPAFFVPGGAFGGLMGGPVRREMSLPPVMDVPSGLPSPALGAGGPAGGERSRAQSVGRSPSVGRESLLSDTERGTERAETASVKHFQGISPRLVEMYRLRAQTAHWSLRPDKPLGQLLSRMGSRRVSMDMVRPMGLVRQTVAVAAAAANAADIAAANAAAGEPLLPGQEGSDGVRRAEGGPAGGRVGAKVAGLKRSLSRLGLVLAEAVGKGGRGGKAPGGGSAEDHAVFAILDPNYDHPPMIGDEDYEKQLTLRERLRLYCVGLIRPEGRTKWDLFILLLLVWVLFASPVIICFGLQGDAMHGDWVGIVELSVDAAFLFDIYLNFRTAYYDSKGHLVTERWRIARHYAKTWFVLDVICVIPYDIITAGTMGFLSMLKLLRVMRVGKLIRMIRMYRLLRVIRLPRILERLEVYIDRGVLTVLAFIMAVGLMAHLSSCLFFYMAYLDGLGDNTWVAAYGVQEADLATKYLTSLYWAFTTIATVGYGDITPKTSKEKMFAIMVMCMGVSLVGYVTSSITNIMAIKNAQQTAIASKKQLVMDVLKGRSVPSELSRRVYNFFNYVSIKMIKREEAALLAELPFKLRARLLQAFHTDMLSRVPAISRLPPHVLIEFVSQLKPYYFVEGDIVVMQGDYIDGLYFVSEGLLEVRTYVFSADLEPWRMFEAVHKDELRHMVYTTEGRLKPRCYFGQAGVLHGGVWPATVIAKNCCELYAIDKQGLDHMLAIQPELQDMLGLPREPVPASAAHKEWLSGPGASPLLPPSDRAVLLADFPIMDPAPQRGLVAGMLRTMGNIITGNHSHSARSTNLARNSTMSHASYGMGAGEGAASYGVGNGNGNGSGGLGAGGGGGAGGKAGGAPPRSGPSGLLSGMFGGGGGVADLGHGADSFSRFRPAGGFVRPSLQLPETTRLLNGNDLQQGSSPRFG